MDKRSLFKYSLAALVPASLSNRLLADTTTAQPSTDKILAVQQAVFSKLNKNAHVYEEGLWTPQLKTLRGLSLPVLDYSDASYTRIGNTVFGRIGFLKGVILEGIGQEACLIISSKGLPGVTNDTEFSGQAYIWSRGEPGNAIIVKNSYASTDIYIGWKPSGSPGPITFSGIGFSYRV